MFIFEFIKSIARRPLYGLFISFGVILFFSYFSIFARKVNHVDYFRADNADTLFFNEFRKTFPKYEFFTVTFKKEEIFTLANFDLLKSIGKDISGINGVMDVVSLATVDYLEDKEGEFSAETLYNRFRTAEARGLKEKILSNVLYTPNLVSKDGTTTSLVVYIRENHLEDEYRRGLLAQVRAILKPHEGAGTKFYLAGWTITNLALSESLHKDLSVFLPLTFLVMSLCIYLLFRNIILVLLGAVNLAATLLSITGLFGLTGITVNNLTAIALPLGLTLCLADTIHIFSYLERKTLEGHRTGSEAVSAIIGRVLKPCLFTSLTTAAGFASLYASSIPGMKDFAIIASLTMAFEFFYSFFLLPPLLALVNPNYVFNVNDFEGGKGITAFLSRWFIFLQRRCYEVLAVCAVLAIAGVYYLTKVPIETNVIHFFKESSVLRKDLNFVESNMAGVASFDVSFASGDENAFKQRFNLEYIDRVSNYLRSQNGVDSVLSPVDFIKELNKAFHSNQPDSFKIPATSDSLEQYLLLYGGKDLKSFVNDDYSWAKATVRMSLNGSREQQELLDGMQTYLEKNPPPAGIEVRPTGYAVNYTNVAKEMVSNQLSSFGTALITIGLLMMLLLRSFKLGLLSLIPNVFPVILTFGIMGIIGINLDTGTIMIASVALGVACDDTVHFLYTYQRNLKSGLSGPDALKKTLVKKGRAIISTALILSLGFSVLSFSSFLPVLNFGFLCTVAMILPVFGDLLLLPALILIKTRIFRGQNKRRGLVD